MRPALALLLALALPLVAACKTDCDDFCEKANECLELPGEEQQLACVEQCERDVEEDQKAEEMSKCAACFADHSCEELFPGDGTVGVCVGDC
jgi:hypothetical protein